MLEYVNRFFHNEAVVKKDQRVRGAMDAGYTQSNQYSASAPFLQDTSAGFFGTVLSLHLVRHVMPFALLLSADPCANGSVVGWTFMGLRNARGTISRS